jgi:16S rRNA processing protein RimM
MSGSRAKNELVTVARVVKPQGRKGEMVAQPLSDRPDRFTTMREVYVQHRTGAVELRSVLSVWPHKGRIVIKLSGVDSIDQAEAFRDAELCVGVEELLTLPDHTYYHHELQGLRVETPSGEALGQVEALWDTGGAAVVLVVRGEGTEHLIPFAAPFIESVEPSAGRLVARRPVTVDGDAD